MTFHWRPSKARRPVGRPLFDDAVMLLEDRIMLDAVPVVSVSAPDHVLLSNPANNFQVTLTFDNTGSEAGFGPYVEVVVPHNGADGVAHGPANADGATFVGASYLGQPVGVAANLTFDAAGHATNPLSGDVVTGTPGDGLVVLQLPFGSFTGPQTPAALIATFSQSPFGNVGVPLTIAARGGFQYGLDPLDNAAADPHIIGALNSATYTPTLAVLTKTSDAPANTSEETATGPNNDHFYTLNLDVANGQKLTAATLSDALPDSIVYLGATVISGGGTITHQPVAGSVVNPADNLLTVGFAGLTGGAGTADAVVKVHFYVNDVHYDGTPVVGPVNGANATTVNTTHLDATFTPLDPIDPVIAFSLDATQADTITDKPVAIQKTSTIVTDTGPAGLNSGDTVEYRLTVQVSDYFSLGNLSLNDVLTDGQRIDTSFLPTIAVTQRGVASATTALAGVVVGPAVPGDVTTGNEFAGTFASTFNPVTGTTASTINLSAALVLGGIDGDGVLAGGRTQAGDAAAHTGGTTVTVTFRAVVQNNFENNALSAAQRAVHQGDTIGNGVTIAASIRDNALPAVILDAPATRDDGTASQTIARGGVGKAIYAINGDTNLAHYTVGGNVQLVAGDTITYRLTYDLPVTSYQALSLTDFLPLPVLAAQTLTFNNAAPFVAGDFAYGPTDTLHLQVGAPTPTETYDAAGNSVRFAYTDYSIQNAGSPSKSSTVDLLFSVAIRDTTFADGLFLTNLATSSESNTPGNATSGNSIVRFALGQPKLLVQKAIVSATSGTITTPETVAGVTFLAPGATAAGRGYTLATPTTALTDVTLGATAKAAATRLNSDVTGLDGGDSARVAIVVNNQGTSVNGAFNTVLDDTLAPGTSFLGGSLATANLIVTRGDGLIFHAGTDYTVTSTATGLSLHFIDGAAAKIEKTGAADHGDNVLVTYDIHLDNAVTISPAALTSSATISNFTAVPAGLNQAIVPPTDAATIGLLQPIVVKALVSTTDASTAGANLTIGENATYEVTYTFNEGTTPLVRLVDLLPRNATNGVYQFVSASIVSIGTNLKQADGTTPVDAAYFGAPVFSSPSNLAQAAFGGAGKTVVDAADNVVTAADTIVVDYVVRATPVATNVTGLTGVNTGQVTYGATNTRVTATAPIGLSLPDLTVVKTFVPNGNPTPDANDPVTFTITVANPGTVTGYAVALSDPFPAGLTSLMVTGVTGAGLTPANFLTAGNALTLLNHIDLAGGQSFTVTVAATLGGNVHPGGALTNTASLAFDTEGGVPAGVARTVTKTSSAMIPLAPDTIAKSILTTSVGNDASGTVDVGEIVTFRLVTTLAEGSSDALTISDALPAGLTYLDAQLVSVGGNITGATLNPAVTTPGGVPTFAFGNVTDAADNLPQGAADQIVVNVRARVANVAGNVSGTVLTDVARVSTLVAGVTQAQTSALPVTVAVPDLVVAKALTSPATPDAGDTATFTINVHHAAGSTAIAYDVALLDALPAGLTNLQVTAVNNDPEGDGANGLALTTANFTTAGNSLALAAPLNLALNQSFTVTIAATVGDATVVGSTLTNTASVTYTTLPGTDPAERTATHSASAALTTAQSQLFTKTIVATDDPLTGSAQFRPGITDLTIGETATVQLVTTLQQGTTPGVVIVDHLPVNVGPVGTSATFGFASTPVLTFGPGITFTGSGTGVLTDTNGDGINDTVTYTLGAVTVPGTPGAGTGALTVTYTTTPLDRLENAAGDALASPATLTSALGTIARNVDYDLVTPNVVLTKAVATTGTPDAGDTVNYTITLTNSGSGPAGDLTLADVAAPGITNVGPATLTVGGVATVFASPGAVTLSALDAGQTAAVTYSAIVADGAVAGAAETNTATASFDSHAGPGGRPGSATGTATFTTAAGQTFTKVITATDDPLTGTAQFRAGIDDLTIGETATVVLTATLQQGTTPGVVIVDHLPTNATPGVAGATFGFVGAPVLTVAPGTTFTGSGVGVLSDTDGDGIADTVTYSLGAVTVPGTPGAGTGALMISYATTPLDRPENAAGDGLASPATLTSALGTIARNVDYDLVAPNIALVKAVATNFTPAGEFLNYTITVTNTGAGPAGNLAVSDMLPPGVVQLGPPLISLDGGPAVPGAFNALPALAAGSRLDITFLAGVTPAAIGQTTQTNVATVTFDSHDGPGGRPGSATGSVGFVAPGSQLLTKTITATSDPLTGTAQYRPGITDLTIGEDAQVALVAALHQGTTIGVVIIDHLPVGIGPAATSAAFTFDSPVTIALPPGTTISGSLTPAFSDTDGDGVADTVTFTLGTVVVPAASGTPGIVGDATAAVTITYATRALDVPGNDAGDLLNSAATLVSGLGTKAASVDYDLVAPALTATKTVTIAAGTPGGMPDAGDTVSYLVTLTNTGTGPAEAIMLVDPGTAGVRLASATVTVGGVSTVVPIASGSIAIPSLAAGGVATIAYDGVVIDGAVVGSTQTNTATATYASSATNGHPGTVAASASFTTGASQAFTKAITATDDPLTGTAQFRAGIDDLAIGETATVTLTATLEQGTTPGVVIVDHLPTNAAPGATGATFGFAGAPVLTAGPGVTFTGSDTGVLSDADGDGINDTVTYTLGAVTVAGTPGAGTGTLTVTYATTPLDRPENVAGDLLASPATLTSALGAIARNVDYDLVAPALEISKGISGPPKGRDAGDQLSYFITITNVGTGPAADLLFTDPLPAGLEQLGPPIIHIDGGPAQYFYGFPDPLAPGATITVEILARVTDAAITGSLLANTATIAFDSHAGPGGRAGSASDTVSFTTLASQALTKTITATDDPLTSTAAFRAGIDDVAIGERATVTIVATLQQGTTNGVTIVDHLPVNTGPAGTGGTFAYLGTPSILLPAGATITGTVFPVLSDTDGDGIADTATFALGNVTIPGTGSVPAGPGTANLTIGYQTTPLDRPENAAGDALASPVMLTSALGTLAANVDYDLVAPNLTVVKTADANAAGADAGDLFGYTIRVTNTGSGPAADLVFLDPLPVGLRAIEAPSYSLNGGPASYAFPVPTLAPGAHADINLVVALTDGAVTSAPIVNTATVIYDSHAGPGGRPASAAGSVAVTPLASQTFTKVITATDDSLTGSAQFRPAVTDVAIGENATVALTTTLQQGTTLGVVIVDHLPVNATPGVTGATFGFVGAPVLTLGAGISFTGSGTGVLTDTDGDGIADTVTYALGAVTVPGMPGNGTGQVTISYQTTPLDRPENAAGDALASPATLTSALGTLAANVDYDLVAPNLAVTKTLLTPPASIRVGDVIDYVVTLTNTGTGPAADINFNDLLPPGLSLLQPPRITIDGGPPRYFFYFPDPLLPGSVATIEFSPTVTAAAVNGSVLTNTAAVSYDSHAGPGGRPATGNASASFMLTGTQALTKTITTTGDPLTGDAQFRAGVTDLAIGEQAGVRVVATLSQGTTNNVVLVDHLPVNVGPAGTSGTFAFQFDPFLSLPAGATITGSRLPVLSDTDGDGINDTVTYNLGTVTLPLTPGAGNTSDIAIFYFTGALDRPENAAGDALASPVTLTSALGTIAATVDYDLVAPAVTVAKSVVTSGTPNAGDSVFYTVTLTNSGTGPAEGLIFRDPGAPGVTLGNALVTTPSTSFTAYLPGFGVILPPLLPGQSDTITYTGVVSNAAITGSTQVNTASVQYLSSVDGGGRPGSASGSAAFTTAATQAFTKVVTATDDPLTGTAQFRPGVIDLAIGEMATVALTATLEQGTTANVVIVDHLPVDATPGATGATFGFVGTPILAPGPGVTFTGSGIGVLSDTNGDGIADTVTYALGNVTVPGTPGAGTGTVVVSYNTTPLDRPENAAGDMLASPATLTSALGTIARNVDYDLVAPNLTITKAVAVAAGGADAGDLVVYTIHLANIGTGPAADIVVADALPPGLVATAGPTVSVDGGPALSQPIPTLAPGSSADVFYTVQVRDAAITGSLQTNVATATYDSHAGPGGRPGSAAASASFTTLASQAVTKTITATDDPLTGTSAFRPNVADLGIGETATVQVVTTLQQGTTANVTIVDRLPVNTGPAGTSATFGFGSVPALTLPAGATITGSAAPVLTDTDGDGIADTVTYALGSVTIPGGTGLGTADLTFTYTTTVLDRPENAAGDALASPVTLSSALGTATANVDVDLVAPALVVTKAVATSGAPDAGDTVNYTVTLTNTGSGPAGDVTLADLAAPGIAGPGPATLTVGGVSTVFAGPNAVTLAALGAGQTATVTYTAVVADGAVAGAAETNTATASFDSHAGAGGRPGSATGSATFTTAAGQSFTKVITATDDPLTSTAQFRPGVTDLGIGENATVQVVTTLRQGTTPSVVIVDHLPVGTGPAATSATFGFVGAPVLTLGAGITFTGSGTGVLTDTDGDGIADTVTYTLGAVTVPGTPGNGTGTVTISYQTTPFDRPENAAGDALASPATLTSALGTLAASVDYDLVVPNLGVTKAVATTGSPDAGDTVRYTVTIANTGTGTAGDLTLIDLAAPGIRATGAATLTAAGVTTTFASPNAVTLAALGAGQTATVTYAAVVADGAVAGAAETNTATVAFDSHPGPGGRASSAGGSATFATAAQQALVKSVVATSEPFTGSEQFRPGVPDLTIGEVATIELRATFSEGTTTGVVLTDALQVPGGTLTLTGAPVVVFADGSTAPFTGTVTTVDTNGDGVPDQVRFTVGTVTIPGDNNPANNSFTIRYQAAVADRPENAAGDALTLPATLTSTLGTAAAAAGVDLVAPSLAVTKVLAADQPAGNQGSVFILTVGHAAGSSAAATGIVLTDLVPAGSLVIGTTIVSGPAGAAVTGGTVTVPLLAIGDTLVARVTITPDFAHPVTGPAINRAAVAYGTVTGGSGHLAQAEASAPIPMSAGSIVSTIVDRHDSVHPGEERRYVSPLLPIEPVYSGAAEPGSYVEIVVTDEFGSISSEGGALTDAGGNWLIRQPSTSVDTLLRNASIDDYYASTRLFSAPAGDLFASRDLFGTARPNGRIDVGAIPAFGTQVVHVNVTDSVAGFNALYAPTWRGQVFVETPGLSVERAFVGAAGKSIARLYDELAAPEAAGLNRFNRAFLSSADL